MYYNKIDNSADNLTVQCRDNHLNAVATSRLVIWALHSTFNVFLIETEKRKSASALSTWVGDLAEIGSTSRTIFGDIAQKCARG